MRLAQLGAGAALSFVFIGVGCSQSPSHSFSSRDPGGTSSTSQEIQGGALDGAAHPFAVGVCVGQKGNCQEFCSGALILPNVVVTARHCVDAAPHIIDCSQNPQFGGANGSMYITTDASMKQPTSGWHAVEKVSVPTDDHICGNDIALLILKDVVPDTEAKPVIPGVQYPMTDLNKWPSRRVTAIGFGNTGPTGFSAGTRHNRVNIPILCIPGDEFIPCPDGFDPNEFYTGDGTCEGDSGSSAFDNDSIDSATKTPISFGVLSRGGDNTGDAGEAPTLCKGGLYTRLDKWRDLIVQTADAASNNWTLYPKPVPDWTIYVPPPAEAGAPDAAAPKPKQPLGDGATCSKNDDCASKVCADTGQGLACTVACDESANPTTCADGYVCTSSVCVLDAGGGQTTTPNAASGGQTTTTSGCSVTGAAGSTGSGERGGLLGIAVAGALLLSARRRRSA